MEQLHVPKPSICKSKSKRRRGRINFEKLEQAARPKSTLEAADPNLWQDQAKAQAVMRDQAGLQDARLEPWRQSIQADIDELVELSYRAWR